MRQYKLIIFDWDGTLMNSMSRIVSCIQAACCDAGIEAPVDEDARNVIGLGLNEACRRLLPNIDNELYSQVQEHYRQHFLRNDTPPAQLYSGVRPMLQDLNRRGYLLAIATGMSRSGLDSILHETGLADYFHATRSVDESASKPNPLMLYQLLDHFDLKSTQAIMVGDTEYDLQMARNAGMDALAAGYGVHQANRLLALKPLACIDSITQMHNWLTAGGDAYH